VYGRQAERVTWEGEVDLTYSEFLNLMGFKVEGRRARKRMMIKRHRSFALATRVADRVRLVIEPASKWLQREAWERDWEKYLLNRDVNTSKRRKWQHITWKTADTAWLHSKIARTRHQKVTALTWVAGWAPTGEQKSRRGYEGDHSCSCGEVNPSKTHILTQCGDTVTPEFWQQWTTKWSDEFRGEIGQAMRLELHRWIKYTGERRLDHPTNYHLQAHMAEDLLTGLWSTKLTGIIAEEVEARLRGEDVEDDDPMAEPGTLTSGEEDEGAEERPAENQNNPHERYFAREQLDEFRKELVAVTTHSVRAGYEIWKGDYVRRAMARREGEQRGRREYQQRRGEWQRRRQQRERTERQLGRTPHTRAGRGQGLRVEQDSRKRERGDQQRRGGKGLTTGKQRNTMDNYRYMFNRDEHVG
jgi:hypothetical protein